MSTDKRVRAAALISQADGIVITAGAGMGVDSGLPDFRSNNGFWQAYPALARARIDFTTIACPDSFRENPEVAWGFYGHRLQLYRATAPHMGFKHLLDLAGRVQHGAFVFTSNVDGQFQKAGFPADRVVEVHGSIHHLQCMDGCFDSIDDVKHETATFADFHEARKQTGVCMNFRFGLYLAKF